MQRAQKLAFWQFLISRQVSMRKVIISFFEASWCLAPFEENLVRAQRLISAPLLFRLCGEEALLCDFA
jgi:hypothetical protein